VTAYIELPIELDPEGIIEDIYADLAEKFPGWEPAAGNIETWLIRALVYRAVGPLAELAADAGAEIFQRFGEAIANVPVIEATPATVTSTWTMIDAAGYTIPAGTQVNIAASGDTQVGFQVVEEVEVMAGATVTDTGEVLLEAVEPGVAGNELTGPASLSDSLSYVVEPIVLEAATSGGTDAEEPLDYLARLAATIQTFTSTPIIARDVEIIARNVPGVGRATALDNFDPATDDPDDPVTWNTEKMTTVAVVDPDGEDCSVPVKDEVESLLASRRETNFIFNVIDPTRSTIKVNFQVVAAPGFAQAEVEANVIAAFTDYLSPAGWGQSPPGDETSWVNRQTLYYQDLVTLINNQEGVDRYTVLKVAKGAAALGTANVVLDGPASLPEPGVIQVGS
jgi:hypothetical protein